MSKKRQPSITRIDPDEAKRLLRMYAHKALRDARIGLSEKGAVAPVFGVQLPDGGVVLTAPPNNVADALNSGAAKDRLFAIFREFIHATGSIGFIAVTEAWRGKQTEAGRSVPQEEFLKASRERGLKTALDRGWITRTEAIVVTYQNEDTCTILARDFERNDELEWVTFGEMNEDEMPQAQFGGRQKMFGDLREENLG